MERVSVVTALIVAGREANCDEIPAAHSSWGEKQIAVA